MHSTTLVRLGSVLLAASFLVTLVLAGSHVSPDRSGELVVAGWLASACLQVGALMLVAGLVVRGLRPPAPASPSPEVDHYS